MSEAGFSFLEGFSKALEPWAAEQLKRKSAKNRMVDQAAFTKAKNADTIRGSATLLAQNHFAPEGGGSQETVINSLIKYANNRPELLTAIRKDILNQTGKYTYGDKVPPGGIKVIGNLSRSTGLSQTEKTLKRRFSEAADAWHTIRDWRELNPTIKKIPTLKILREKELENMNIQGKATYQQEKLATENAARKQSFYNSLLTGNSKALFATGRLGKGIMGETVEGDPRNNMEALISGMYSASEGSALNAAMPQAAAEAREESSISNLWGLLGGDETPSAASLNLTEDQQKAIGKLINDAQSLKKPGEGGYGPAARRTIARGFLDQTESFASLEPERKEKVRKLLEALLK